MRPLLRRNFYSRSPLVVANELIGKTLVRRLHDGTLLEGVIVEAEAYGGKLDPASHAFRGKTPRNEVMFGKAGRAYVYFIYGFHNCLNFVTGSEGIASAVLIRSLEPTNGLEKMAELRKTDVTTNLTNGPGKLCQALSIDRSLNAIDVTTIRSPIRVIDEGRKVAVSRTTRIGITARAEKRRRF